MASIKIYTPQVTPGRLPGQSVSADAFGANVGQAMGAFGNVAQDWAAKQKEELDTNKILEVRTAINNRMREYLHTSDNAIFSRKGGSAVGSYDESKQVFNTFYDEGAAMIGQDPKLLEAWNKIYFSDSESYLNSVAKHEATERKNYNLEVEEATLNNAINGTATEVNDPDGLVRSFSQIDQWASVRLARGTAPEKVENERIAAKSAAVAMRAEVLASQDPVAAGQLIQSYKSTMTQADYAKVDGLVIQGIEQQAKDKTRELYEQDKNAARDWAKQGAGMKEDLPKVVGRETYTTKQGTVLDLAALENKYGVKRNVMAGLIDKESSGDETATGPLIKVGAMKGMRAQGLTQFMPPTADEYGIDPRDPRQAVDGMARYLRKGLDRFNGDYAAALAGYNAGNRTVEKAMERAGSTNWDDWKHELPQPDQTIPYVEDILKNAGTGQELAPAYVEAYQKAAIAELTTLEAERRALSIPADDPASVELVTTLKDSLTADPSYAAKMTDDAIREEYRGKLSPQHIEDVVKFAQTIRNKPTTMSTAMTAANDIIRAAGLEKGEPGSKQSKTWLKFKDAFWKQIVFETDQKGTELSYDEVQDVATRMLTKVYESDWIFDNPTFYFEASQSDNQQDFYLLPIDEIPAVDKAQIREMFEMNVGRAPTENEIETWYMHKVLSGNG